MEKQFNTAGPCKPNLHYMLDPLQRIDLEEILQLIYQERYFILHAPRQSGKTTSLLAMVDYLNTQGQYLALYVNIERGQGARENVTHVMGAILSALESTLMYYHQEDLIHSISNIRSKYPDAEHDWLNKALTLLSFASTKPLVLFFDEVDALVGDSLISFLRQLRAGYNTRPRSFPSSVVLCGVRDLKDYRMYMGGKDIITGGSAFNIKAESLRLGNFSFDDTKALWLQHTEATGQQFAPEIFDELWLDTMGQPWLVNALGHQLTWKMRENRDRKRFITLEMYKQAREALIQSRATHLDQLVDKLREPRVQPIIADLLSGEFPKKQYPTDDLEYVEDLGLIRTRPQIEISNRIYKEVIPRELVWTTQAAISYNHTPFVRADHSLDFPKLLREFQQFYRENAEAWLEGVNYKEVAPQLLLMAFLQRVINGGGRIEREYALGRKRMDLFVEWPLDPKKHLEGPKQKIILELEVIRERNSPETVLQEGLRQTRDYATLKGVKEAHLVLFDRRPNKTWDEKIYDRVTEVEGYTIHVWGL
jgi:hypothetical protein